MDDPRGAQELETIFSSLAPYTILLFSLGKPSSRKDVTYRVSHLDLSKKANYSSSMGHQSGVFFKFRIHMFKILLVCYFKYWPFINKHNGKRAWLWGFQIQKQLSNDLISIVEQLFPHCYSFENWFVFVFLMFFFQNFFMWDYVECIGI